MHWFVRAAVLLCCTVAALLSCRDASLAYWASRLGESLEAGHAHFAMPAWAAQSTQVQLINDQHALWMETLPDSALPRVADNARAELVREPLEPSALYQLGMLAERRAAGTGRPLFELVERVTRREVPNELELEGLAVQRADNAAAIAHVDHAVLYVPALGDQIFPALVPAIADPAILKIIMRYADRPWYYGFIRQAIDQGGDPDAITGLIRAGSGHLQTMYINELNASLISALINSGNIGAARRISGGLAPDIRKGLGEMGFSQIATNPHLTPLSWTIDGRGGINTRLEESGTLAVTAGPEQSGLAASRVTMFAPGTYAFVQTIVHDASTPRAGIVWDVLCAGQAQQVIWHQPVSFGQSGRTTTRATVIFPTGCDAQAWRLQVVGADGDEPSTVSITNLAVQAQ